jgi:hypothetical protein
VRPVPVPCCWPNSTMVLVAGGPSVTAEDVDTCRGHLVLAIKDTIRLAPWADVLYGCDAKWWTHHGPTLNYHGPRFALEDQPFAAPLKNTGMTGLETDPIGLRTGKNSGYQAINLAMHLGARRIVLLGYDMQPSPAGAHHWFGAHPYHAYEPPYRAFLDCFETIVEPLKTLGVTVINATRTTALKVFPQMPLAQALA